MEREEPVRWEYETLRPPRGATKKEAEDPEEELNRLGAGGWELVETIAYGGGGTKYLVFKRPASGDPRRATIRTSGRPTRCGSAVTSDAVGCGCSWTGTASTSPAC